MIAKYVSVEKKKYVSGALQVDCVMKDGITPPPGAVFAEAHVDNPNSIAGIPDYWVIDNGVVRMKNDGDITSDGV